MHLNTVKSCNYESRNNNLSQKYNRFIDDAIIEILIEKSYSGLRLIQPPWDQEEAAVITGWLYYPK